MSVSSPLLVKCKKLQWESVSLSWFEIHTLRSLCDRRPWVEPVNLQTSAEFSALSCLCRYFSVFMYMLLPSRFSHVRLCDHDEDCSLQTHSVMGFSGKITGCVAITFSGICYLHILCNADWMFDIEKNMVKVICFTKKFETNFDQVYAN